MQTYAEQRAGYEAARAASAARMKAIMDESAAAGETMDASQSEEFDTCEKDIEAVDAQIKRLKTLESLNLEKAAPASGGNQEEGTRTRSTIVVPRAKEVAKGIGFTRYVIALAAAKGNPMHAVEIAKSNERWHVETPEVETILRTAVAPGNTTDSSFASPLVQYQNLSSEFAEFLRPLTIIGRLKLRNVPFKVKIPRQTGASSVNWVGEGAPKPVSGLAFDSITMDFAKIAGIVVLTEELVKLSTPAAEELVRQDLADAVIQFMDSQFVDPSKAATSGVSPASITNGVTPITASGTTGAALRADTKALVQSFVANNLSLADAVWLMTQQQAIGIGLMQNALGQYEFPGIDANGGKFIGLPVITSENIPATGNSPADGSPIILVKQSEILLADDGQVTVDASREASLQMDTAPDSPATASTTMVSLWQQNMVGIRAERYINWAKRRATAVGYIQNAKYFE